MSTPILRSTAIEASRSRWYSLSVRVCAGRHRDRVAGVHAHRVEVLDRADDDAVVAAVAHHLHLVFFPADHRFLDQQLVGRRGVQAALADRLEFLAVVGDAAAGAAQREGRAGSRSDSRSRTAPRAPPPCCARCRARADASPISDIAAEFLAVLGHVDGPRRRRSSRRCMLEHALAARSSAVLSAVWPPMVGSSASRPLLLDDARDDAPVDRLDVDRIGRLRVGHDGGRVGVHQDDPVALLAQRLAGLRAGVIELARLADDDRTGADDQDALDVGTLRQP